MTFENIDRIADSVFWVFALALLITAVIQQKGESWKFILRTVLAVAVCQQLSKRIQKLDLFHHSVTALQKSHGIHSQFPSTHFAVVLCLATGFFLLNRRLWWVSVAMPVLYGALLLYQTYHTPIEMLGALYAIPLTWFVLTLGTKRNATATGNVVTN